MVAWYKHDIPAWMDGTEDLSSEAYRAYHVICQLIYLNEGPIAVNEHGIAGRCRQSLRTFRKALNELTDAGKLTISDGRISNSRAQKEIEKVGENRINGGKGGLKSGKDQNPPGKPLKTNDAGQASLAVDASLKTRLEETREEKKEDGAAAPPNIVSMTPSPEKLFFDQAVQILGPEGRSLAAKLLKSKDRNILAAHSALLTAAGKANPREYIGAIIRGDDPEERRRRWAF